MNAKLCCLGQNRLDNARYSLKRLTIVRRQIWTVVARQMFSSSQSLGATLHCCNSETNGIENHELQQTRCIRFDFRAFVFKNRFRLGGSLRCKYQNNFSSWSGTRPWVRVPTQSKEIKKWAFLHEQEEPVTSSSQEPLHLDIWCWVRLNLMMPGSSEARRMTTCWDLTKFFPFYW